MTVFQVDLFSARGAIPRTMADVAQREKEIRFSSRTRFNTDMQKELQRLRGAAHRLSAKLPAELKDDPDARLLAARGGQGAIAIMHLINRGETSRDYDFSRQTVNERWDAGAVDVGKSLAHKDWAKRKPHDDGIVTFDLAGDVT